MNPEVSGNRVAVAVGVGPAVGAVLVLLVYGSFFGFRLDAVKVALFVMIMFGHLPSMAIGLPIYFAARRASVLTFWPVVAVCTAVSGVTAFALSAMVGAPRSAEPAWALILLTLTLSGLLCGAVNGVVFWRLIVKPRPRSSAA